MSKKAQSNDIARSERPLRTRSSPLMPKEPIPPTRPRTRAQTRKATTGGSISTLYKERIAQEPVKESVTKRRVNPTRKARPVFYGNQRYAIATDPGPPRVPAQPPKVHPRKTKQIAGAPEPARPAPKLKKPQLSRIQRKRKQPADSSRELGGKQSTAKPKPAPPQQGSSRPKREKLKSTNVPSEDNLSNSSTLRNKDRNQTEEPQQRATPPDSNIRPWLASVQSLSSDPTQLERTSYNAPVADISSQSNGEMASSTTTRDTNDNDSTVKGGTKNSKRLTYGKLRFRHIDRDASKDPQVAEIKNKMKEIRVIEPIRDIEGLSAFTEEFGNEPDDSEKEEFSYTDRFSLYLDKRKSEYHYPIINPAYFAAMLKKCRSKNEAVLQRTIMMSIFHLYWLGEKFDWNTEGLWSQPSDTLLKSTTDDSITLPKPDLAISFSLSSLTKYEDDSDPFPLDIERCLSPDGGRDDGTRCFPFLFMEVKRAGADLNDAYLANLHTASQALCNIYQWMERANMEKEFFEKVRVITFVFNAQDLEIRVHRAKRVHNHLAFCFAEFFKSKEYGRDTACNLFTSLLKSYAEDKLHPLLQKAFRKVSKLEEERVANKRKAGEQTNGGPKRARSTQRSTQDLGESFGISGLQT